MPPTLSIWPPETTILYGMVLAVALAAVTGALCRRLLSHAEAASARSTAGISRTDATFSRTDANSTRTDATSTRSDSGSAPTDSAERPPSYGSLGTGRFVVAVALTSLLAGTVVVGWAPTAAWPVWCGICSLGVLLGWIDAATTWLPSALVHPLWVLTGLGIIGTGVLTWLDDPATWWVRPMTAIAAAIGYGLFFAVVWRIGRGGLGFGDVRLALVLGAATGACSLSTAVLAAVLGTALGALWAIGRLLRGRRESFPYGPFLLLGAVLAPILS